MILLRDKLIVCLSVIDTCVRRQKQRTFVHACMAFGVYKSNRLDKVKPQNLSLMNCVLFSCKS